MPTEKEPNLQTAPTVQAQFLRSQYRRGPRSLMACRSAGLGPGTFDSERLKVGKAFFPRPPNLPLTAAPGSYRHLTAAIGSYRHHNKLQIKMSIPSAGHYKTTTLNKIAGRWKIPAFGLPYIIGDCLDCLDPGIDTRPESISLSHHYANR